MNFYPDVTVAAVVERDGSFLMVEEMVSGACVLNQPAGHLESGESLLDAVVRETLEETAWLLVPQAFLGVYLWRNPDIDRTFLRFAFVGRCDLHHPGRELDEGICRAIWKTRDEIISETGRLRSPMVLRCIDDFIAGRRYPLDALSNMLAISHLPLEELKASAI